MIENSIYLTEYTKTLIESEYPQYSLFTESDFRRFLDSRGINIRTENLEHFEKEGFLLPVIRLNRPKSDGPGQKYSGVSTDAFSIKGYIDGGYVEFPTRDNFREWDSYRDGYEYSVVMLYHPYQILIMQKLLSSVSSLLKYPLLENVEEYQRRFDEIKPFYDQSKAYFLKRKPQLMKRIGLFFNLQDAYQPIYRRSYIPDWRGLEDSFERWKTWKEEQFSPEALLKSSRYSIEAIINYRNWLAAQVKFIDPIKNFYMLFRLIPYRKRMKLSGKALLAQDYYEFIGILNLYLKDLTGKNQPDPDDILDGRGGAWKKDFYGDPFTYSDPQVQRKIVEDYISNSLPKLLLLVEGDTEEESIPIIANAMNFYFWATGVEIYNYEGTGGLKGQNIRGTIDATKKHGTKCFIISDNDERAQEYINDLKREGLLNDGEYAIWEKEYEEDNFGLDEILEIINAALIENGMEIFEKQLVEEEIRSTKFLMKSFEDAFWKKYRASLYLYISKPKIGNLLGLKRAQLIREEIKRGDYKPTRKIEEILVNISKML